MPRVGSSFDPSQLLASVPAALACVDAGGHVVWLNPAAESLIGRASADVAGSPFAELIAAGDRSRAVRAALVSSRPGRRPRATTVQVQSSSGHPTRVALRVHTAQSAEGGRQYLAYAYDLDDMYAEVEELKRSAGELTTAAQIKAEFFATMTHEIRTPMNGVIGMTNMLLDTKLDRDQRTYIEIIQTSANALLSLVDDILDFSRVEAGDLNLETLAFDLRRTVDQVASLMASRARKKGLNVVCTVQHEVPPLVSGDPGRLRQVLLNLVGNAIKFTEHGEISIGVERVRETDSEVALRFTVTDTGVGMTDEQSTELLQSHPRAGAIFPRRFSGNGLGLSICTRLVSLMGGEMGVTSRRGEGSTFWFRLKLTKPRVQVAAASPRSDLKGTRVLVVDSARTARQATTEMLTRWQCIVGESEASEEALELLRDAAKRGEPYRVALLDAQMPMMDGEALGRTIRADALLNDTRLVLLTNFGRRGDAARVQGLGFSGYLIRPVQQSQLFDALIEVGNQGAIGPDGAAPSLVTRHTIEENRRHAARVLVVEDNPINQLVTVAALRRVGYQAEVAANGKLALDACASRSFDLILMDCQMPGLDGYETTVEIRTREGGGRRTPIIAMTANAGDGDRKKCLACGMDDYLTKPIDLDALAVAVKRWTLPEGERAVPVPEAGGVSAVIGLTLPTDHVALAVDFAATGAEAPAPDVTAHLATTPAESEPGPVPVAEPAVAEAEPHRPAPAAPHDYFHLPVDSKPAAPAPMSAALPDEMMILKPRVAPSSAGPSPTTDRAPLSEPAAPAKSRAFRFATDASALPAPAAESEPAAPVVEPESERVVSNAEAEPFEPTPPASGGRAGRSVKVIELDGDETPVLDRDQLEDSCMGSSDLRKVLIQTFLGEIFPRLARLGNRVAAGDNVGVEFEAHGLKGMCAALGAKRCADVFGQLERMGREQELQGAQAAIDRAEDEVNAVSRVVGAVIEASDSAAPPDDESSAQAA